MVTSGAMQDIFETVRATLSESFVTTLGDGIEASFALWNVPGTLGRETGNKYFLQGTLGNIVEARAIIQRELLRPIDVVAPETTVFVNVLQELRQEVPETSENIGVGVIEIECTDEPNTSSQRRKQRYEEVTPFKYLCHLCSFKSKRNSHYLKHMKIHEKVATVHRCGRCSFTTVRLGHLRRHQASHSSVLQRCSRCSYATDNPKLLLRHNRVKHRHGPPAEVLECPQCSYRTTRPQMLARHGRSHLVSGPVVSLHQCEQCSYKTRRKEHLVRHRNNVHGDARPFLCHQCGKAFKRGDALRQHHLTHVGRPLHQTPFPCSHCCKTFRTQSHLTEHQATHSLARPFLCEVCGAAFKTRSVQRKHVQTVHCNPRAFSCPMCLKKFNTQYALKRHQKLHSPDGNVVTS